MRGPFLCPDCQKLGYCRKYNTKKLERTFDESEQAFFEMVNKPAKKVDQENPIIPVKLISLEKMRAQFRSQETTIQTIAIQIISDFSLQLSQITEINNETSTRSQPVISPRKYQSTVRNDCYELSLE